VLFFVLTLPNLRSVGINMPFAVHWNPPGAKQKIAKLRKNWPLYLFILPRY